MSTDDVKVPFFKKKGKGRPTTSRKRSASPPAGPSFGSAASSSTKSEVVLPTKKNTTGLISAGTKRTLSQRDADTGYDDDEEPVKDGPDVKWTAENSHRNAALDIIAGDEIDEVLAKRRRAEKGSDDEGEPNDDGQYRGAKNYKAHLQKSKEVPKAMRVGPQRNTSTIRTVTVVDYQPDVCKDYKETGYCGFGDTCKFLHDRGTYLAGWQLDNQWDANAAARNANDSDANSDSDSDDEDLPFACLICRKPYTDPVVTRCGHYYCQACAIKRYGKTPKCLACGAPTAGIFNRADKIFEKIEKKKKKQAGGEGSDEEGGGGSGVEIEGLGGEDED